MGGFPRETKLFSKQAGSGGSLVVLECVEQSRTRRVRVRPDRIFAKPIAFVVRRLGELSGATGLFSKQAHRVVTRQVMIVRDTRPARARVSQEHTASKLLFGFETPFFAKPVAAVARHGDMPSGKMAFFQSQEIRETKPSRTWAFSGSNQIRWFRIRDSFVQGPIGEICRGGHFSKQSRPHRCFTGSCRRYA